MNLFTYSSVTFLVYGILISLTLFFKHQSFADITMRKIGYENMKMKNQVAYTIFTLKMQKESGTDDCPMFVNEMLNTDDNKIAFVIKQKEKNTYTVSMRSKEGYNVAKIASIFGGGGHIQAAGFAFTGAPIRHSEIIYKEVVSSENVTLKGNYRPYGWVPHATLAKHLTKDQMKIAFEILQNQFGPFEGSVVKIGLARTNPYKDIEILELK